MSEQGERDKFIAMVTARADVTLPISSFHPRSMLHLPPTTVLSPRFPVIDYHNHLDAQEPRDVLKIMDECGIEHMVNITMKVGEEALVMIDRYGSIAEGRFSTIGWMDWRGADEKDFDGFIARSIDTLERQVERGIVGFKFWKDLGLSVRDASGQLLRVDDERLSPYLRSWVSWESR